MNAADSPPDGLVNNAIQTFCDRPRSDVLRDRLVGLIEPNRQTYIAQARRRFEGVINGVTDGRLHGRCRLTGAVDPVTLDLLLGDKIVLTFRADALRQDLLDAGFGVGNHGFTKAIRHLALILMRKGQ